MPDTLITVLQATLVTVEAENDRLFHENLALRAELTAQREITNQIAKALAARALAETRPPSPITTVMDAPVQIMLGVGNAWEIRSGGDVVPVAIMSPML